MTIESDIHTLLTTFRKMERDWYKWRSIIDKTRKRIEKSLGKKLAEFNSRTSEVLKTCAREFKCNTNDILSKRRPQHIADARHCAMWIMVKVDRMTTLQVASLLERDHSGVSHGISKVHRLMATDRQFKSKMTQLIERLKP